MQENVHRVVLNNVSYHGPNATSEIPRILKEQGCTKVLVCTDHVILRCGTTQRVTDCLKAEGIAFRVFTDIQPNPTIGNVQDGVETYRTTKADSIVAIGGGSVIDTAKAIGIIAANPEFSDVRSLEGETRTENHATFTIAVPTTAGTAAETTTSYVIADAERRRMLVCIDEHAVPEVAVVDSRMMETMPVSLIASTGMDALAHAIEGYLTHAAWDMTDMFHLHAIELICTHLRGAVARSASDMEKMALAQYISGMGSSNVGLGIVHAMAHALSAFYDTPHGLACAVLLAPVMEFNAPTTHERYREIARALGVDGVDEMQQEEYRQAAVDAVRKLGRDIGIPTKLDGAHEEDIPKLAQAAFKDVCRLGNPRNAGIPDLENLFRKLIFI